MRHGYRNNRPDLVLLQNRNADIHAGLLAIGALLTNRSLLDDVNKSRFNEAGRQDRPLMPARIEQEMLRAVGRAVARDGRPALVAQFRELTRAYYDKRCADVLSEIPAESETDIVSAYLAETQAQGVTEPHQATAACRPECVVSLERAVEHSRSYRRRLDVFIAAGERQAARLRQRFNGRPSHLKVWV